MTILESVCFYLLCLMFVGCITHNIAMIEKLQDKVKKLEEAFKDLKK